MHNLKLRIMFYSVDFLRTQAQEEASQIALRGWSEEEREEPGYMSFCNKTRESEHQNMTVN